MAKLQQRLADLVDHSRCVQLSQREVSQLHAGTYPPAKVHQLVDRLRSKGCGFLHDTTIDPRTSARFQKLSSKQYKPFSIDESKDNVFHAFLQGLSFIMHHHALPNDMLKKSTKALRARIVDTMLQNKNLQNAIDTEPSVLYHRQFEVQQRHTSQHSYIQYSRRMGKNAYASYPELAGLSKMTNFEIHIYDPYAKGSYIFAQHIRPTLSRSPSKRYVIRLLRKRNDAGVDHFDVLLPVAFIDHAGPLGKKVVNSPEKALRLLESTRSNKNKNTNHNLPSEANTSETSFSWSNSPKLGNNGGTNRKASSPKQRQKLFNVFDEVNE